MLFNRAKHFILILCVLLGGCFASAVAQTKLPAPKWQFLAPVDSIWTEISLKPGDVLEWSLVLSRLSDPAGESKLILRSDVSGEIWKREFDAAAVEASDNVKIKTAAKYRLTLLGASSAGRVVQMSAWANIGTKFRDPFPIPSERILAFNFAVSDRFIVDYEFMLPNTTSFDELMAMELPTDLIQGWALTPEGDSLAAKPSVNRWFGQPGMIRLRERAPRGGRITLRLEWEIPMAGQTVVHLTPGKAAPPEWLPEEVRVMTTHIHAPWHAVVVPPFDAARHECISAEPPLQLGKYAAQSLRVRGLDSLLAAELTQVYLQRDSLCVMRRSRLEAMKEYDSEFLTSANAFLPPEFHVAVTTPLAESQKHEQPSQLVALRWFVDHPPEGSPGKLYVWLYDEGLTALPQAPDEIYWNPQVMPLNADLRTYGGVQAEFAQQISLDPEKNLRPSSFQDSSRTLLDFSQRVLGLYLENTSQDTIYLVYRQETPIERSVAMTISRWPKAARIAIVVLLILGVVGIYALYELRQREQRRRKHAEEYAADLDKARQVQEKLLPKGPIDVRGLEVLGLHQSMQSVGGDYYDFFQLKDGRILICVADVAGHGLAAALLMSNLQATLHAIAEVPRPLNELVGMLNQEITKRTSPDRFVTLIIAEISADRSQLNICNAGHNPGYLIRKNGKVVELDAGGIMLGVMEMFPYIQMDYGLEPGDLIALYTDGIPEAEIGFEDMFGYDRLQYFLSENRDGRLQDIAQKLFKKVTVSAEEGIDDDMAIVLIRMKLQK
ncbi:serine/threonine-protein phosphatase [bacterium]|nr:serine/threonine-protein phosphatase [bacterium]